IDPDAGALLLDLDGNVTETSGANFLMVREGTIVSPPLRDILPGVSRATVIELAAELRVPFVERDFPVDDALKADEAFLASTPYCLMPASRLKEAVIGNGTPGPVYRRLIDAWNRLVGLNIERQIVDGAARRLALKGPHGTR